MGAVMRRLLEKPPAVTCMSLPEVNPPVVGFRFWFALLGTALLNNASCFLFAPGSIKAADLSCY